AIIWGELDGNRHPSVGNIVYRYDGDLYPWASGSLVANNVFLTAGHVTNGISDVIDQGLLGLDDVFICFDSTDTLSTGATLHAISEIITHPDYRYKTEDWHDVGMIILQSDIEGIAPVTLPTSGLLDELKKERMLTSGPQGTRIVCVGYGSFLEFPPPRIVYENKDRYLAKAGYLGLKKHWIVTLQNGPAGYGGTGYGDSGGPNFWVDGSGKEILVAVTSKGDPNLVATNIAYRVDTPEILGFIKGVIASHQGRRS
ncbi:MAG: trypsin-like serine protease, partial [Candidatus Aminicenantes bacterium]|nr:trypsin-like serine protease [Candidatus Aminicenantes bacterium]